MVASAILIFAGPTLSGAALPSISGARFLPPAAHGDVYRATLCQPLPRVLLLLDGYFRAVPAVRHKEILWALSQGIHVLGAASIGALRAAELALFGMVGVGKVFEAFRAGVLEDDDEVAVAHGPAELGYPPVSEAMVDIRATLEAARHDRIIGTPSYEALVAAAKAMFYPDRAYGALFARAAEARCRPDELDALRRWLPQGRRSQKREDALVALGRVQNLLASDPAPFRPDFHFEETVAWREDVTYLRRVFASEGESRRPPGFDIA